MQTESAEDDPAQIRSLPSERVWRVRLRARAIDREPPLAVSCQNHPHPEPALEHTQTLPDWACPAFPARTARD